MNLAAPKVLSVLKKRYKIIHKWSYFVIPELGITLGESEIFIYSERIKDLWLNSKKLFKFDSIKFLWQPNQSFLQRPLLILHNCVKGDGTNQAMRKFSRLPI